MPRKYVNKPGWRDYSSKSVDRLEYVEGRKYTRDELERIADTLLHDDPKKPREDPAYLPDYSMRDRCRHEIFNENGVPDPGIVSGVYWRTHPQGLTVRRPEEHGTGTAFYR